MRNRPGSTCDEHISQSASFIPAAPTRNTSAHMARLDFRPVRWEEGFDLLPGGIGELDSKEPNITPQSFPHDFLLSSSSSGMLVPCLGFTCFFLPRSGINLMTMSCLTSHDESHCAIMISAHNCVMRIDHSGEQDRILLIFRSRNSI